MVWARALWRRAAHSGAWRDRLDRGQGTQGARPNCGFGDGPIEQEAAGVLCSQEGLMGPAFGAWGVCVELRCEWEWADGPGPGVVEMSCPFECLAKTGG